MPKIENSIMTPFRTENSLFICIHLIILEQYVILSADLATALRDALAGAISLASGARPGHFCDPLHQFDR